MLRYRCMASGALLMGALIGTPLSAQSVPDGEPSAPDTSALAESSADMRIFTPEDFARFAPKTAYDMLGQIPGFTIRTADTSRGLGQATENILINGLRITDKSGGAATQLQKVPAGDVLRIEIRSAASLGIPGLTGQVASVILRADRKASGNFSWSPRWRTRYARPGWFAGSVSYSGKTGDLGYTLSLENQGGRGGAGGSDYYILGPDGTVIETRDITLWSNFDQARASVILNYGGSGPVQANLNLVYNPYWKPSDNTQRRMPVGGIDNRWDNYGSLDGLSYDLGGDVSFQLGRGRLKLIGLYRNDHAPAIYDQRTTYDNGDPETGTLYARDARGSETIGRAEYSWKAGRGDWTISLERAFNRFAQASTLAALAPDGSYSDIPYPQGSGIVGETRYEGLVSLSRPLGPKLDLQLAAGAEYSTLGHLDFAALTHTYFRPKGSVSLAWQPTESWDASLKLERRVGQISFSDFLGNTDLTNNHAIEANPDLVPPQAWELTGEVGRNLGSWGKVRFKFYHQWIEDIVDRIPIGPTGDAVGNLPRATRSGVESTSTFQFDPIGWKGAKLDVRLGMERSRVRDPLDDLRRPISNTRDRWAHLSLRQDIAGTQFAWGAALDVDHFVPIWYPGETDQAWEGPYVSTFIEAKDVGGLDIRLTVFNLTDGLYHFDRVVSQGRRGETPVLFAERQRLHVGQIFTLLVKGTF